MLEDPSQPLRGLSRMVDEDELSESAIKRGYYDDEHLF